MRMNLYNIEKVFGIMNLFNIDATFKAKAERNWDTIYVAVDLHGTLVKPFHDKIELYPAAIEVMKFFTRRPDIKLILWTSSHEKEVSDFVKYLFNTYGILFDFVNCNLLEASTDRANFKTKFYFNILLDDKAGFEPETDWASIQAKLICLGEWDK